jgi:hypothetical protein
MEKEIETKTILIFKLMGERTYETAAINKGALNLEKNENRNRFILKINNSDGLYEMVFFSGNSITTLKNFERENKSDKKELHI